MPTYFMLLNWTDEGVKTVKDAPKRVERARNIIKSLGGEMKAFYMVFGRYDMIGIIEAPDDEAAAKLALGVAEYGAARGETLRAFEEADAYKIIKALP